MFGGCMIAEFVEYKTEDVWYSSIFCQIVQQNGTAKSW